MISEVVSLANLLEKLVRLTRFIWQRRRHTPHSTSARFFMLFEQHDVYRNQIPRFFGQGLSLKDVQDEAAVLNKLDDATLDAACQCFGIRREWLEGADAQIYPYHDFYKSPETIERFLLDLKAANPNGQLSGVLLAPDGGCGHAVVVLQELIGEIGTKGVYRYHLCNNWRFEYWRSRTYLTALIAIAWKNNVHIRGITLPAKKINAIAEGACFIGPSSRNLTRRKGPLWSPEDMAIQPDAYLHGINREDQNYGHCAALKLWLTLENEGFMATAISSQPPSLVRQKFEAALEQYTCESYPQ